MPVELLYPAQSFLLLTDSKDFAKKRKAKTRKAKWYKDNHEKVKAQSLKWYKDNTEKAKAGILKWQKDNLDKVNAMKAKWYKDNSENMKIINAKLYKNNPEKKKALVAKWQKDNPEKVKAIIAKWRKTPNGKISHCASQDYRKRELGSNIINDWFVGCNRHHINTKDIICIPKEIHKEFYHNHKKSETMILINRRAFEFLSNSIRQI